METFMATSPQHFLIFGMQGSGKGTQAALLAERMDIAHIAPGDIFRKEIAAGTALGKELASFVNKGLLVPDKTTIAVLRAYLAPEAAPRGWILDGFPRSAGQQAGLEGLLADMQQELTGVFFLDISDDEVQRRLTGRRICKNCGAVYNVYTLPPKKEGICDACGSSELIQRTDETPEAIAQRIAIFREQTLPLIEHYQGHMIFHRINAEQPVDVLHEQMFQLAGA